MVNSGGRNQAERRFDKLTASRLRTGRQASAEMVPDTFFLSLTGVSTEPGVAQNVPISCPNRQV